MIQELIGKQLFTAFNSEKSSAKHINNMGLKIVFKDENDTEFVIHVIDKETGIIIARITDTCYPDAGNDTYIEARRSYFTKILRLLQIITSECLESHQDFLQVVIAEDESMDKYLL